ncbi:hypothetical protein AMATHDRAFT_74094 [Amanita thiersii Skay4041]|uniref:Uncharacterized protein n=1 Tax=Amanita thiersii Skay4041 TaxID=703135 RepID=A0A2A9NXP1_9AGAR|nr:hypothetical protein AMATHDRAFT_74094 [Amanita thiersii Skay4041]
MSVGIMLRPTDSRGIPIEPTWSVNELLSSYPKPVISSKTLRHIHELSALIPPEEGTPEHDKIQQELGDLVKLVEAVKLVNTDDVKFVGRNYKEDWDMDSRSNGDDQGVKEHGTCLLEHAARTMDGYYAVDADRQR